MIRIEFYVVDNDLIFYVDFPSRINVGDSIWFDAFVNQENRGKLTDEQYDILMDGLGVVIDVTWNRIDNQIIQRAYVENTNKPDK
jgi:hypothetical protein